MMQPIAADTHSLKIVWSEQPNVRAIETLLASHHIANQSTTEYQLNSSTKAASTETTAK
jgi:hypothetical protein